MRSAMQIAVKPGLTTPAYDCYRQDQDTTATIFQVDLNADSRLTLSGYAVGEYVLVRFTQDAAGGHLVNWTGATFEGDATLLVPDPTASTSSFVLLVCRTDSSFAIVGPGGGGGGGGVATVTGTAPITSSGGANPAIGITTVTAAARGAAPANATTLLDAAGRNVAAAAVLGARNVVHSTSLATSIGLPAAVVGQSVVIELLNFAGDLPVIPTGPDTIDGVATTTIFGTANAFAVATFDCAEIIAGVGHWVQSGGGPALPLYVAPPNEQIGLAHAANTLGNGVYDPLWHGDDAAPGAFDGGGADPTVGAAGQLANHPGVVRWHLGQESSADSIAGRFELWANPFPVAPETLRASFWGYGGGLHVVYRGGTMDWGVSAGTVNISGANAYQINFSSIFHAADTRFDQVTAGTVIIETFLGVVNTAGAAPTVLGNCTSVTTPDTGYTAMATATGRDPATGDCISVIVLAAFQNVGGVLTRTANVALLTQATGSLATATVDLNTDGGTAIVLHVTGVAATPVHWSGDMQLFPRA